MAKKATTRKPKEKALRMTSIRLDPEIVQKLRQRADALGVGWQTVLKMIVTKYVDSDL